MSPSLKKYGYRENSGFEGVIPRIAEKIGSTGFSDSVTSMFSYRGPDSLSVPDVMGVFSEDASGTTIADFSDDFNNDFYILNQHE